MAQLQKRYSNNNSSIRISQKVVRELLDYIRLFDMSETRDKDKLQPHVVPVTLVDNFLSSTGHTAEEIMQYIYKQEQIRKKDDSNKNNNPTFEFTSFFDYMKDERVQTGALPKIKQVVNSLKLLIYHPSLDDVERHVSNCFQQYYALMKLPSRDKFYTMPIEKQEEYVGLLKSIFENMFPDYFFEMKPYGSFVIGLGFSTSYLKINIELSDVDLARLYDREGDAAFIDQQEPHSFITMKSYLESLKATKVEYNNSTNSVRFKWNGVRIEYNFNKEINTRSYDMIAEYFKLDDRVLPFIQTLKLFFRANLRNHGIRFYAFQIMALSYLISLDPPVLPNLQNLFQHDPTDTCRSAECNTKFCFWDTAIYNNKRVGVAARFHDCVVLDRSQPKTQYQVEFNETTQHYYWNSANTSALDQLLMDFMCFWGYHFDYSKLAISLKMGGFTTIKQEFEDDRIIIEDPFMSGVNLARDIVAMSSFVEALQSAFLMLYQSIPIEKVIKNLDLNIQSQSPPISYSCLLHQPSYANNIKTLLFLNLPELAEDERESHCYCKELCETFSSLGMPIQLLDYDYEVKLITFYKNRNSSDESVNIPSCITIRNESVYVVELLESKGDSNQSYSQLQLDQ